MVNEDIYSALEDISGVDEIFDTKRDDGYSLTGVILVFSNVSDSPDVPLDLELLGNTERWQISIYGKDLTAARAVKPLVIAALHGYEGGSIKSAEYTSGPGHIYEPESLEYHIPLDFVIES